jgi:hypothetical protein
MQRLKHLSPRHIAGLGPLNTLLEHPHLLTKALHVSPRWHQHGGSNQQESSNHKTPAWIK